MFLPVPNPPLEMIMAVDAPADGLCIAAGTAISGFGWVLTGTSVASVRIELESRLICQASIGVSRPDLHAAFGAYPDAGTAGFEFSAVLDSPLRGAANLSIIATAADGRQVQRCVGIQIVDTAANSALPPFGIWAHIDNATLTSQGELYVFGWAISEVGIERVGVWVDGIEVSDAQLYLERADIGPLFPNFANAGKAGFGLHRQLQGQFGTQPSIAIVVKDRNGGERRLLRTVEVAAAPPATVTDEPIKLAIDVPARPADGAVQTLTGGLVVQGWAIARAEVDCVVVSVDGADVGVAYYGIRREDVAAVYADWPGSSHCGYGISIPAKALNAGPRRIALTVRDRKGATLRTEFPVLVEPSTALTPHENIRTCMNGAELLLDLGILEALSWHPRFECAVLMDHSAHGEAALQATLASLEAQEYEHWRVRITSAAGLDTQPLAARLRLKFPHIADRIVVADEVGEESQDPVEWVCIMHGGDRLGCDALLELAMACGLDPTTDFLYADERRRDPSTASMATWFKPRWSPDLLLSSNYIGRAWCARRDLFSRIGLPIDGNALRSHSDYERSLRLTHAARRIQHLPKVLFDAGDAALDSPSERAALEAALAMRSIDGEIHAGSVPGVYRLRRNVAVSGTVSVIIPTCGARHLVQDCVRSLRRYIGDRRHEIICIENIPQSDVELKHWLHEHTDRVLSTHEPFNWSRFNNLAAAAASNDSEFLLFLNDDIEAIEPGWLDALLEHAQRPDVGVVGPLLLYADRRIQHAGMFMVEQGRARHAFRFAQSDEAGPFGLAQSQRNVLAVTGACLLMRRSVFETMGGFDEAHRIVNNDMDFCLRCRTHSLKVIYTPYSRLIHHEMASRSSDADVYDAQRFEATWGAAYADGDPYYSPALTTQGDDFSAEAEPFEVVFGGHPLIPKHRVRSILALKVDHIGDFITALPAVRRIKLHFPDARLTLMTSATNLKLARLEPCVDDVIEFDYFHARSSLGQRTITATELAALQARLGQRQFDVAIDLRKHLDSRVLLRHVGAKFTAGYDYQRRFPWLDVALEWEGDSPLQPKRQHISDDLLRLVDAVGTSCASDRHTIDPALSAAWAQQPVPTLSSDKLFRKPVVCIHAASGNPLRKWPDEYFVELVRMIIDEYDVNITLIGGVDEELAIRSIWKLNQRHPSIYPLAGILPLRHLPHLLSRCVLFVGNNSGPQHIAAGLGIPAIGIHSGVVDATEWAPVGPSAAAVRRNMSCSPCYLALPELCRRDLACLKMLRPGDVLKICRKFLAIRAVNSRHAYQA